MPRRDATRREAAAAADDDVESVWSDISAPHVPTLTAEGIAAAIDDAIANMTQRRATTRVEGILALNKLLSRHVLNDAISSELGALCNLLKASIKRGAAKEVVSVCHAIELLGLSLGDDAEDVFATLAPTLRQLANHAEDSAARKAALRCLGVVSFLEGNHFHHSLHWMHWFAKFFRRKDADVSATALDAWGLVASGLVPKRLLQLSPEFLRTMIAALHSNSLEVRSAAGENIALLYEAQWEVERMEEDSDDEDSDADSDDDGEFASDEDDDEEKDDADDADIPEDYDVDVDELEGMLEAMAKDGTRSRARSERARQRSLFRDVLKTVKEGLSPRVSMKIAGESHSFGTWRAILKLSSLRQTLAEGYHTHIAANAVVRSILELEQRQAAAPTVLKGRQAVKDKKELMYEMRLAARARQDHKKSSRQNKRAFMKAEY